MSCPFALVAALDDELRIIKSRINPDSQVYIRPAVFTFGQYMGRRLLIARTGVGRKAMAKAISYCLTQYHPEFCLHVGYCGGADPSFQAGDLLIATAVADKGGNKELEPEESYTGRAVDICRTKKLKARTGRLLTVDEAILSPHEKAFVGTQYGIHAIDMESFSFAAACQSQAIPYLIVRAVLDPLDMEFPDMGDIVDGGGVTRLASIARHVIKKPRDIFKLPRVEYLASEARGAITQFVDAWLENVEKI